MPEFRVIRVAIVLIVLGVCVEARGAERARVVLEYARKGKAERVCPDEGTFRALVAARLGYDPFVEESSLSLRVALRSRGGGLDGKLRLTADGQPKGTRTMKSAGDDCYELAASLALASAVAVDPEGALARRSVAEATPSLSPTSTPDTKLAPSSPSARPRVAVAPRARASGAFDAHPDARPAASSGSGLGVAFEAGGAVTVGTQPSAAPLFRVGARLGGGGWSMGLEGAASLSSEQAAAFGAVSAHVVFGSFVPCARPGLGARVSLDLCAVMSAGALFSDAAQVTRSSPATDRYATVGPRVGFTWMLGPSLGFAANVEAKVTLSRVHLVIEDAGKAREGWSSSPVGFIGGVSLVWQLR